MLGPCSSSCLTCQRARRSRGMSRTLTTRRHSFSLFSKNSGIQSYSLRTSRSHLGMGFKSDDHSKMLNLTNQCGAKLSMFETSKQSRPIFQRSAVVKLKMHCVNHSRAFIHSTLNSFPDSLTFGFSQKITNRQQQRSQKLTPDMLTLKRWPVLIQ